MRPGRRSPGAFDIGDAFGDALAKVRGPPLPYERQAFARTDITPAWRAGA